MKELLFITAILGILHSCGDLKKDEELEKQMEEFASLYQQERNLEVEPIPYYTSYYPLAGEKN